MGKCSSLASAPIAGHTLRLSPQFSFHRRSHEGTYPCYLCHKRIRESEWNSGEHRRECREEKQEFFSDLETVHDEKCPKCGESLKVWPAMGAEVRELHFPPTIRGDRINIYKIICSSFTARTLRALIAAPASSTSAATASTASSATTTSAGPATKGTAALRY